MPPLLRTSAVTLLLVSGSDRRGSTNAAVLRTAAALAPAGVETEQLAHLGELPLFNPDDDVEGAEIDPRVLEMRTAIGRAGGLLICTPEYAGALPAALKNLLEWTIGDAGTYGKPVAWINAAGPAAPTGAVDAHASLRKVLGYAGADIVERACARVPAARSGIGADGLVSDDDARRDIGAAIATLAEAVARTPARGAGGGADQPDPAAGEPADVCVIEIPKGSRNKYEYDPALGAIKFDRLLMSAATYPTDYGYVRDTLGADGDPLDVLVCLSEPTFPGCLIPVKPIGMFEMRDEAGEDNKIVCVPFHDPYWNGYFEVDELPLLLRQEIEQFFSIYKVLEKDKTVEVGGWCSSEHARREIATARRRFQARA